MRRCVLACAAVAACVVPAFAEYGFHAILIAEKTKFPLVAAEDGNMKCGAQNQENRLDFAGAEKATDDWKTYSFSFVPQGSGDVNFSLEGQWAGDVKDPVLVSNIRVNGKLMKNGDFKQTFPYAGKTYPMNMWIMPPGLFQSKAGPDGMNAVSVTYSGGLRFSYPVKENKTYVFEVEVKKPGAASAPPAPQPKATVPAETDAGKTQTVILKPGKGYRITVEEL